MTGEAEALFPEYESLYGWFEAEVDGLSDAELDYTSSAEEWSWWGIRRQVSHCAYVLLYWMVKAWGKTLWPEDPPLDPVDFKKGWYSDRQLDPELFHQMKDLLAKLREGVDWAQKVLHQETPSSLRQKTLVRSFPPSLTFASTGQPMGEFWASLVPFHPGGIWQDPKEPDTWHLTLEWTLRHLLWEVMVHLRTIQRLKMAQALPPRVEIPRVGYLRESKYWGG